MRASATFSSGSARGATLALSGALTPLLHSTPYAQRFPALFWRFKKTALLGEGTLPLAHPRCRSTYLPPTQVSFVCLKAFSFTHSPLRCPHSLITLSAVLCPPNLCRNVHHPLFPHQVINGFDVCRPFVFSYSSDWFVPGYFFCPLYGTCVSLVSYHRCTPSSLPLKKVGVPPTFLFRSDWVAVVPLPQLTIPPSGKVLKKADSPSLSRST